MSPKRETRQRQWFDWSHNHTGLVAAVAVGRCCCWPVVWTSCGAYLANSSIDANIIGHWMPTFVLYSEQYHVWMYVRWYVCIVGLIEYFEYSYHNIFNAIIVFMNFLPAFLLLLSFLFDFFNSIGNRRSQTLLSFSTLFLQLFPLLILYYKQAKWIANIFSSLYFTPFGFIHKDPREFGISYVHR